MVDRERLTVFTAAHRVQKSGRLCRNMSLEAQTGGKGKGKVYPRTGHEGPEGEWRYSSTLSLTSALDRGGWSTPRPGRFTPGNDPVPIVQLVASRYTD
jgi:hypothetical protein